jgi:hypothetical protein
MNFDLQKESVKLLENGAKCHIHQINHDCDYEGSNGYYNGAALQLAPGRPGNFID